MIDFNDPTTWITADIHEAPSGVDVELYQSKIDEICGLNPYGGPNVRLTWAPSMENYYRVYSAWDKAGFGTATHLRGRYTFQTIWDDENCPIDVPAPRWVLEQWLHPSQYIQAESLRWKTTNLGNSQTFTKEMRPPHPENGIYVRLERGIMRKHNGFCCVEAKKEGAFCWGFYRAPDDYYLGILKRAVSERDAEALTDPNSTVSDRAILAAGIEAAKEADAIRSRAADSVSDFVDSNLDALVAHYTNTEREKKIYG